MEEVSEAVLKIEGLLAQSDSNSVFSDPQLSESIIQMLSTLFFHVDVFMGRELLINWLQSSSVKLDVESIVDNAISSIMEITLWEISDDSLKIFYKQTPYDIDKEMIIFVDDIVVLRTTLHCWWKVIGFGDNFELLVVDASGIDDIFSPTNSMKLDNTIELLPSQLLGGYVLHLDSSVDCGYRAISLPFVTLDMAVNRISELLQTATSIPENDLQWCNQIEIERNKHAQIKLWLEQKDVGLQIRNFLARLHDSGKWIQDHHLLLKLCFGLRSISCGSNEWLPWLENRYLSTFPKSTWDQKRSEIRNLWMQTRPFTNCDDYVLSSYRVQQLLFDNSGKKDENLLPPQSEFMKNLLLNNQLVFYSQELFFHYGYFHASSMDWSTSPAQVTASQFLWQYSSQNIYPYPWKWSQQVEVLATIQCNDVLYCNSLLQLKCQRGYLDQDCHWVRVRSIDLLQGVLTVIPCLPVPYCWVSTLYDESDLLRHAIRSMEASSNSLCLLVQDCWRLPVYRLISDLATSSPQYVDAGGDGMDPFPLTNADNRESLLEYQVFLTPVLDSHHVLHYLDILTSGTNEIAVPSTSAASSTAAVFSQKQAKKWPPHRSSMKRSKISSSTKVSIHNNKALTMTTSTPSSSSSSSSKMESGSSNKKMNGPGDDNHLYYDTHDHRWKERVRFEAIEMSNITSCQVTLTWKIYRKQKNQPSTTMLKVMTNRLDNNSTIASSSSSSSSWPPKMNLKTSSDHQLNNQPLKQDSHRKNHSQSHRQGDTVDVKNPRNHPREVLQTTGKDCTAYLKEEISRKNRLVVEYRPQWDENGNEWANVDLWENRVDQEPVEWDGSLVLSNLEPSVLYAMKCTFYSHGGSSLRKTSPLISTIAEVECLTLPNAPETPKILQICPPQASSICHFWYELPSTSESCLQRKIPPTWTLQLRPQIRALFGRKVRVHSYSYEHTIEYFHASSWVDHQCGHQLKNAVTLDLHHLFMQQSEFVKSDELAFELKIIVDIVDNEGQIRCSSQDSPSTRDILSPKALFFPQY